MAQRNPQTLDKKPVKDINDIKTEEDFFEFFKDDSSPQIQDLLELYREQIARGDKPLTDEDIRYEVSVMKHGQQVADALRENEKLKREVEQLKQQVESLKLEKEAA